ncbi:hypothetical protein KSS87_004728 [Heliosperma pusillum]|nr:hypothetical protein KSS87_004728 [Heliosperma pusillum]
MGRAPCCDKENVKRGPWSPEEDAKLKAYIDNYGTGNNWIALPQKIGKLIIMCSLSILFLYTFAKSCKLCLNCLGLKRCGKSCRLRWLNYLRPNIKHGGFTDEEDNIILSLYISIGSRWSIIAAQLPGRTDNDIKNYWNTRLKKKLLGRRKQQQGGIDIDGSKEEVPTLSNSALDRLQLHMQLQSQQTTHQNSFSYFNNPSLCPKLHPLIHQKLIQNNFQSLNQIQHFPYDNNNPVDFIHQNPSIIHQQELENSSLNGSTSSDRSDGEINDDNNNNNNNDNNESFVDEGYIGMQKVSSFQRDLNELLSNDKMVNELEGMGGWWSNDSNLIY